jgi:hypothetical protein
VLRGVLPVLVVCHVGAEAGRADRCTRDDDGRGRRAERDDGERDRDDRQQDAADELGDRVIKMGRSSAEDRAMRFALFPWMPKVWIGA